MAVALSILLRNSIDGMAEAETRTAEARERITRLFMMKD